MVAGRSEEGEPMSASKLEAMEQDKVQDSASRWGLLVLLTIINVLNFVDRQLLPSFANFIKP